MKDYIEERAVLLANYIIDKKTTVRRAAKEFNISKSTVHKDVTERLSQINRTLYEETKKSGAARPPKTSICSVRLKTRAFKRCALKDSKRS